MESFQELGLPEFLADSIKRMNFDKPTPVQAQAIPPGLEGKDVIASAQTGTGKTAAFGIPLLTYLDKNKDKTALILTPTRELAVQVQEVLRKLSGTHHMGPSVLLIGGANMGTQFTQLTRKPRLIIGTPGRVIDHLNRGSLNLSHTGFLVLDEADRMLDMGFAPQLDEIRKKLTAERQTLLFSATMPNNIQQMASKYLKNPVRITIGSATQPIQKIAQKILYTTEAKKPEELSAELKERQGSILIFTRTQHRVDRVMNRLKEEGLKVTRIHGGRTQSQRRQAIDQFREGKFLILVATDIAARGLDIHHIAHVINYDLPRNPEDYIHRVGRTARAGAEGEALCFLTPEDRELWGRILKLMGANKESIIVKPSHFGFTAPKEGPAPSHSQGPRPGSHGPQRHSRPPQGGRPSGPHPGREPNPSSHSRPPHREGENRGFQGAPRDSQSQDFRQKNRHPDGRHQQRSQMHQERFQAPREDAPENVATPFDDADEKQPMSNASRNWGKPEGFIQRMGRKFMGGGRPSNSGRPFQRENRGGFRADGRPGQGHRAGFQDRPGFRKEGGYAGPGGAQHRRPSQGDRPNNGPRPFAGDRPHRSEHRPGEHSFGSGRPGGERRPGNFNPKGGFKRSGPGKPRPGGFRPH
jgi:ATP-dependent RNA helicase DeaD